MGVDTTIIFTPVDQSWVASPGFIRNFAALLRISVFKKFWIYREVPCSSDTEVFGYKDRERLLEAHDTPVETAIALQRIDPGYSNLMGLDNSPFTAEMLEEMVSRGSPRFEGMGYFEGFTFTNGSWESYEDDDDDGHPSGSGMCSLGIWMAGSPAAGNEDFLREFLALETIARLKSALEELSAQLWTTLVHVW